MKKILYTATSDIHLRTFHFPYLHWLKSNGYVVHVAIENRADFTIPYCDKVFYLPFKRFPFHPQNLAAYFSLRSIIKNDHYHIIHCHTPSVSVITRLAAIPARRNGTKVIFTSHGFHFFRGAGLTSWLLYYPIEKILSCFTDAIVTINQEDFELCKRRLSCSDVFQIPGMGVDPERFYNPGDVEKLKLRQSLDIKSHEFVIAVVGELNKNKNQKLILRSLCKLEMSDHELRLLFVGKGRELDNLKDLASRCNFKVDFLGWKDNVEDYVKIADLGISASKREGLGIALVQFMRCGVPVIASDNRGHREIIKDGIGGLIFESQKELYSHVKLMINDKCRRATMGNEAQKVANRFLLQNVVSEMATIYGEF